VISPFRKSNFDPDYRKLEINGGRNNMIELMFPDFEVLIHLQYNDFGKMLENKILLETASYVLAESTEYQGVKDYHWSFKTWEEAVSAANALKKYCDNPNVILLKAKANYNIDIEPIVLKNTIIKST
jgi:hypothetical protein